MSKRTLFASIASALIAIAVQPLSAATPSLSGSWQFTLSATSPASDVQIPGLATFTADGSAIETDGALYAQNVTTMLLAVDSTTGSTFKGSYTTVQVMGTISKILSSGTVTGQLIPHVPLP